MDAWIAALLAAPQGWTKREEVGVIQWLSRPAMEWTSVEREAVDGWVALMGTTPGADWRKPAMAVMVAYLLGIGCRDYAEACHGGVAGIVSRTVMLAQLARLPLDGRSEDEAMHALEEELTKGALQLGEQLSPALLDAAMALRESRNHVAKDAFSEQLVSLNGTSGGAGGFATYDPAKSKLPAQQAKRKLELWLRVGFVHRARRGARKFVRERLADWVDGLRQLTLQEEATRRNIDAIDDRRRFEAMLALMETPQLLGPLELEAIHLCDVEELSIREAAQRSTVPCSQQTMRKRRRTALAKLLELSALMTHRHRLDDPLEKEAIELWVEGRLTDKQAGDRSREPCSAEVMRTRRRKAMGQARELLETTCHET